MLDKAALIFCLSTAWTVFSAATLSSTLVLVSSNRVSRAFFLAKSSFLKGSFELIFIFPSLKHDTLTLISMNFT